MTQKLESGLQHLGYHLSVVLVWTVFGGEVQFVEATSMAGKGDLHLTGQLGDVIKESAQIALTWVRSRATELKFAATKEINLLEGRDVHIHFPAGAIPKDGPSTGVALLTVLVLLFSQTKVRSDTTMTREMTLQGLVLPVGGVKDKIGFADVKKERNDTKLLLTREEWLKCRGKGVTNGVSSNAALSQKPKARLRLRNFTDKGTSRPRIHVAFVVPLTTLIRDASQ
ncbi:hypothetical protein AgCh_026692 [Apium graveolens]